MSGAKRSIFWAGTVAGAILLAGCQGPTEGKKATAPGGWILAFSDDFERQEPGKEWESLGGYWDIRKGWLTGKGQILCAKLFPGNQRLEMDCRARENACDLSVMLMAGDDGVATGYFYGFGSEYNTYSKLLVQSVEVKTCGARIEPGKVHHVVCEFDDGKLTHIVDGKTIQEYVHDEPLKGEGQERLGLYVFSWGQFDNIRVYTKPHAETAE